MERGYDGWRLEAEKEYSRRIGAQILQATGFGERFDQGDPFGIESDLGVLAGRAENLVGLRHKNQSEHVAGLCVNVSGRVRNEPFHRHRYRDAVSGKPYEGVVDGRLRAA